MGKHIFNYKDLTMDDIEVLSLYFDYICDGDMKKIIVIAKEE